MATRQRELDDPFRAGSNGNGSVGTNPFRIHDRSVDRAASARPIRILIIENHQVVADALEALLNEQPGMAVVGSLATVADARSYTMETSPDVMIVDFHLRDGLGAEAVHALRANRCRAQVIFLTHDDSDLAHLAAIEAGASAFLHKSQSTTALMDAIRRVASGESLIEPSTIASLIRKSREVETLRNGLTPRETEVLHWMAKGVATRDIASKLGISYTTVRTHIRSLGHKLGSHSKLEVVVRARALALVS